MNPTKNNHLSPDIFRPDSGSRTDKIQLDGGYIMSHRLSPDTAFSSLPEREAPVARGPAPAATARNFPGPEREGFGGEKAAQSVASLPVPPALHLPGGQTPSRKPVQARHPAKGSGNAKGSFRRKAGRAVRISAALTPTGPHSPPNPA